MSQTVDFAGGGAARRTGVSDRIGVYDKYLTAVWPPAGTRRVCIKGTGYRRPEIAVVVQIAGGISGLVTVFNPRLIGTAPVADVTALVIDRKQTMIRHGVKV